jgi:histidine triad (HIT) family protein
MTSSAEMPCVFCEIIAGRAESSLVYEDEYVIAFMDIRPLTQGHVLVVPRSHADCLEVLDEDLGACLFRAGHRLTRALRRSGLPCEGVNLFLADGEAAFQEAFHVHLHVLPRTAGDGFRIEAAWRRPGRGSWTWPPGKCAMVCARCQAEGCALRGSAASGT